MKYLRSEQIIPNKGMSYTYYEIEGEDQIRRMATAIPDVGEYKIYPKPKIKQLWQPERLPAVSPEEFEEIWQKGQD